MILLYSAGLACTLLVLVTGSVRLIFSVGLSFVLTSDYSSFIFLFTLLSVSVSVLT